MMDLDIIHTVGDPDGEADPGTTSNLDDKGTANVDNKNATYNDRRKQPQDLRYFLDRGRFFRNRYRN